MDERLLVPPFARLDLKTERRVTNVCACVLAQGTGVSLSLLIGVKEDRHCDKGRSCILERRDAEFEPKMAEVLCVYREQLKS